MEQKSRKVGFLLSCEALAGRKAIPCLLARLGDFERPEHACLAAESTGKDSRPEESFVFRKKRQFYSVLVVLDIVSNVLIYLNIEISMYHIEDSIYRIERVLPSIPWLPRVSYADTVYTERKLGCVKYRNRIDSIFFC